MTIAADPTATIQDDQSVEYGKHRGMTKTVYRIRKNGTLKFKNKHNTEALKIKSDDMPPPFLVPGVAGAQSEFIVLAGINLTVTISGEYDVVSQFAYSAQIEGTTAEDPIVIVDRR